MPDSVTGASSSPLGNTGVVTPIDTTTRQDAPTSSTSFNSITGTNGSIQIQAAGAKSSSDLDKDAFLKLLVAQLKYQNPMSPADPNEFLGQTAQFTMVEKLEEISKAQSDLTVWQKVTAGQSLVGREVTGKSDLGTDVTSVVTGLTLGTAGPQLLLADGSKMDVASVSKVTEPAASKPATSTTPPAGTGSTASGSSSSTPTGGTSTAAPSTSPAPTEATPTGAASGGTGSDTSGTAEGTTSTAAGTTVG